MIERIVVQHFSTNHMCSLRKSQWIHTFHLLEHSIDEDLHFIKNDWKDNIPGAANIQEIRLSSTNSVSKLNGWVKKRFNPHGKCSKTRCDFFNFFISLAEIDRNDTTYHNYDVINFQTNITLIVQLICNVVH